MTFPGTRMFARSNSRTGCSDGPETEIHSWIVHHVGIVARRNFRSAVGIEPVIPLAFPRTSGLDQGLNPVSRPDLRVRTLRGAGVLKSIRAGGVAYFPRI